MVYFGLTYFEPRIVSFALITVVLLRTLLVSGKTKDGSLWVTRLTLLAGVAIVGAVLIFNKGYFIKLYPFFMSAIFFFSFAYTLWSGPSMIERFAQISHKELPEHAAPYLRTVTMVWCGFFIVNGAISLYTTFYAPLTVWTLYNGFISYVLIGTLLVGEYLVRLWYTRAKK